MSFRILGLSPEPFLSLYGLPDAALAELGARRVVADAAPGYPDRVEMRDAAPGESLLLVNHVHHDVANPYRASHAIFVREGATRRYDVADAVPDVLRPRVLSLRAFDADDLMTDADLVDGRELERAVERMLADERVAYLHAHYAKRGCYAGRIERA
jgi:hypothetical protein